jgi:hypothetical protein
MAREVWQQVVTGGEGVFHTEIEFPNDWDASSDLFYLESIWIDGVSGSITVVLASAPISDIANNSVAYSFDYYGGMQDLPNPWVMALGYSYIGVDAADDVRVSFFGNRKTSKANEDLALVAFGKAVYELAPTP